MTMKTDLSFRYSDFSYQYLPSSTDYPSSAYYNSSSMATASGQPALSSQYFHPREDAPTTSTQYGTTSTAATPGYTTLTTQELHRHDAQLQSDQRHTQSAHRSHRRRPHAAANATHSNVGMSPSKEGIPQQQYNTHPPVTTPQYQTTAPQQQYTPSSSITNPSYSHTQYTPPSSISSTGYNQPHDPTYWTSYGQSPTSEKDLTDWGYDLAGVGSQFQSNSYAYSNEEE